MSDNMVNHKFIFTNYSEYEMKQRILHSIRLQEFQLVAIYPFGSRIYGTYNYKSDYDFYVIANDSQSNTEIRNGDLNIHLYTPEYFQTMIDMHRVGTLECIMLPKHSILQDTNIFNFKLDLIKLRSEFSRVSNNSWVKAKKKIEIENDLYIGKKSLWHALRIMMFGIQIASNGKIINYDAANQLYRDIINSDIIEWPRLKDQYQPLMNNLASEFRKVAPK